MVQMVMQDLHSQILATVAMEYLSEIEDNLLSFGNIVPKVMLVHLLKTYVILMQEEIKENHATLMQPWSLDEPIEEVWVCIQWAQQIVAHSNEPIPDMAAICLTLAVFKNTGMFMSAIDK